MMQPFSAERSLLGEKRCAVRGISAFQDFGQDRPMKRRGCVLVAAFFTSLLLGSSSFAETAPMKSGKQAEGRGSHDSHSSELDYIHRVKAMGDDLQAKTQSTKQRFLKEAATQGDRTAQYRFYGQVVELARRHKEQLRAITAPSTCQQYRSAALNFLEASEKTYAAMAEQNEPQARAWHEKAKQYLEEMTAEEDRLSQQHRE